MITKTWEFDTLTYDVERMQKSGTVDVQDDEEGSIVLSIQHDDRRLMLVHADLDQWGTWYHITNNLEDTIAWEHGTRSFLDALINGLTYIRSHFERGWVESTVEQDEP